MNINHNNKFVGSKIDDRLVNIKDRYTTINQLSDGLPISFEARILDVHYTINDEGKIQLKVKTDVDYELKSVISMTRSSGNTKNIFNIDTIKVGDIFRIVLQEDNNFSNYYWVWVPVDIIIDRTNSFKTDVSKVEVCPVCHEVLTDINHHKYCLNDQCPAKIKFSIRRFLQKATLEEWYIEDILIFDKLITLGRIKNIADIYTLTKDEINSLDPYFVDTEANRGTYLINKINNTRGTVTLFRFINSLCVPQVDGYLIKEDGINKSHSIDNLLEILSRFTGDKDHSFCISKVAAHILRNYLNRDSTQEYITRLIEENVFEF
jgi:hypothetical protein